LERKRKGKYKFKTWDKIVVKLKGKFLHVEYYTLNLYNKLENLSAKYMIVKEYTKFYKLYVIFGHGDEGEDIMTRYIIGLRYAMQYELSIMRIRIVGAAYKFSLKDENKLFRKQFGTHGKTIRGRCRNVIGRGQSSGTKDEEGNNENCVLDQRFGRRNETFRGRGSFGRIGTSRGRGARRSPMICYKFQMKRH